jgi:hypothetical protein
LLAATVARQLFRELLILNIPGGITGLRNHRQGPYSTTTKTLDQAGLDWMNAASTSSYQPELSKIRAPSQNQQLIVISYISNNANGS